MATPKRSRKDQIISARLDGDTAEMLDILARRQGTSHAAIIRRAIHHLAIACQADQRRAVRP